ncbi:MAG: hypothetical protein ACU0BF_10110 [Paracoccaceae bacterium]
MFETRYSIIDLFPIIISALVAVIAYQQWRTARDSLRERMFERRWRIFQTVDTFAREVHMKKQSIAEPDAFEAVNQAKFLFPYSVHTSLERVYSTAMDYGKTKEELGGERLAAENRGTEIDPLVYLSRLSLEREKLALAVRPIFTFPPGG